MLSEHIDNWQWDAIRHGYNPFVPGDPRYDKIKDMVDHIRDTQMETRVLGRLSESLSKRSSWLD